MQVLDTTSWLTKTVEKNPELDTSLLKKAIDFAHSFATQGKVPFSDNTLAEGLFMADELLELNCDTKTLAAAIIYPSFYYFKPKRETVCKEFSPGIYKIISSAKEIELIYALSGKVQNLSGKKQNADNLRKLLLAVVDDVRIVLIKLSERLAILDYLRHHDSDRKIEIAEQTMYIYAPLANRLGIGQFKWQLEDLAFRFLEPEKYKELSKAIKMRRTDREQFIENMLAQLKQLLTDAQMKDVTITGRAKHMYSLYKKLDRKNIDMSEIYDALAFRILVPTVKDCYEALAIVHSTWPHIPKEFDDYIANPKPNGYQSIHTAVKSEGNINIEIQIRTHEMHESSELGVAAHWKYKEGGGKATSTYEEKINLLRDVIDFQKEVSGDTSDQNISKIFDDRVYVFTPSGDVLDLEAGSTPLDFAYYIHTDVGHRCRGAKVNDKLVQLTHQLQTGDRVEILTGKENNPSRDWVDPNQHYLKSSQAINKVRAYFRKENFEYNLELGNALWEKAARKENFTKTDLNAVASVFNLNSADDLIVAVGSGHISVANILQQLHKKNAPAETKPAIEKIIKKPDAPKRIKESHLVIEGVGNLLSQLARCCKPIPGDAIIGYITKGRGVTIHQQQCINAQQALESRPERVIEVQWGSTGPTTYPVDIDVEASDRPGLVRDISNVIAAENISVLGLNSRVNKLTSIAYMHVTIEIKNLEPLNKILNQLRQIPNILRVQRR